MNKILVCLALMVFMVGCDQSELFKTSQNNSRYINSQYQLTCIDHVEYIVTYEIYRKSMSPHYHPDGTLYLCQ